MAKIDRPILLEIVRIIQSEGRVPDMLLIQKRSFSITYLEDHRQRMEEALRRGDLNRLNMLFGQLESKIKYQAVRTPRPVTPAAKKTVVKTAPSRTAKKTSASPKARPQTAKVARGKKTATPKVGKTRAAARPSSRQKAATTKSAKTAARAKKAKSSRR